MSSISSTMSGYVLTGFGGMEKLVWQEDLRTPNPGIGEVLIRVGASSVNNTDINARIGWYSKAVTKGTIEGEVDQPTSRDEDDWIVTSAQFPRIQGADCCGEIVAVGSGVDREMVGERVLVRAVQPSDAADSPYGVLLFGWDCDGAFAEYTKALARHAFPVRSGWTDTELASVVCAFSTAEGMLERAAVGAERVLITGASGGVGSAAVQLAKRRGAVVTAVTSPDKAEEVRRLGADRVVERGAPIPAGAFDVAVDLVAGPGFQSVVLALGKGGRYVTAGAIAGPIVTFDARDLYLNDKTLYGATYQPEHLFGNLVRYIEKDEIRPVVAKTFGLRELHAAQEAFLRKDYVGKIAIQVRA